jgi:hypothetical protein
MKQFYLTDYTHKNLIENIQNMFKDFGLFISQKCGERVLYAHDLGSKEGYYLINYIHEFTQIGELLIDNNNNIISIDLPEYKIKIYDSKRILVLELEKLSIIYNVKYPKLNINDFQFNLDNLNEKKEQLSTYIKDNVLTLLEVLNIVSKFVWDKFHVDFRKAVSTSSLAMKIYRTNFLKEAMIPVLPNHIDKIIRKAYKGGYGLYI